MARPSKPSPEAPKPSPEALGLTQYWREPETRPYCPMCTAFVDDPDAHARAIHGVPSAAALQTPEGAAAIAPIESPPLPMPRGAERVRTPDERLADQEHPGGAEGARIERLLADQEQADYRAWIVDAIGHGYGPVHLVVALAYQLVLKQRVQVMIEEDRDKAGTARVGNAKHKAELAEIDDWILKLTVALEKQRESRILKTDNPQEILDAQSADAEQFIQANIGEFQFQCPDCGVILTTPALPHWAFAPHRTAKGEREFAVWSPELWTLVRAGTIPLHLMAYVLRTSPEGIKLTAARRGEVWPEGLLLEPEEVRLRRLLDRDDDPSTAAA